MELSKQPSFSCREMQTTIVGGCRHAGAGDSEQGGGISFFCVGGGMVWDTVMESSARRCLGEWRFRKLKSRRTAMLS